MNSSNSINSKTRFLRFLPISLLALSFFWAYFDTFTKLVKSWTSYDQAHTAILLVISLYLLWTERTSWKQLSPRPSILAGSTVTFLGCIMLIGGKLSNTLLLQYISVPITVTGIIILTRGFLHIKAIWLPIAYLFFVFGLFDAILSSMSIYLQYAAAWTASGLLKLIGMPVVLKGLVIQLPHISLEVERGCSGQKHILALLALAVPIVYLRLHGWLPRFLLLAIAFFTGIFGNGIRIAIIGLWSINHPDSIHGPFDIFYVSFIFFFGIILFLFAIWIAEGYWPRKHRTNYLTDTTLPRPIRLSIQRFPITFGLGTLILCVTALSVQLWRPNHVILQKPLESLTNNVGAWSAQAITGSNGLLKNANPDSLIYREYINSSGNKIGLNIAYFKAQNENKRIVSYRTDWLHNYGVEPFPLAHNNGTLYIGRTLRRNEKQELETVYFWYNINGDAITDRYMAKIKTIVSAAMKRQTNGAITVISFPQTQNISDSEQRSFLQQVFPLIQDLLKQTRVS